MKGALILGLAIATGGTASALDLVPVGGVETGHFESPADSVRLPVRPWNAEIIPPEAEGAITKRAFSVANPGLTTLQLLAPLRIVLELAGYEEVYSCADVACGGFYFRFQLDLLPAPDMFVDLGNYRYVLMRHPEGQPENVAIVTSVSSSAGHVHVTTVSTGAAPDATIRLPDPVQAPVLLPSEPLIETLVRTGRAVLADLDFQTGSAALGDGSYASLETLAAWLNETPSARVVLVGHSDAVGSLEANALLSRRRAQSVLTRLTGALDVSGNQVAAEGAGALAPLASNLNEEGRAANRRVEVVLLALDTG